MSPVTVARIPVVGAVLDSANVPADVRCQGGGWMRVEVAGVGRPQRADVYVHDGAHRDGSRGWRVGEIRPVW